MSTGGTLPSSGGSAMISGGGGHRSKLVPQVSTVWTRKQNAVCVRRACKTYGTKKAKHVILDNLNMTVPKGCIYGLLGASGCGKTTLLSCIVGRRRLNSGEIWVLGGTPGSRGSGVPGPRIGYMPQEIALYGEFTIKETLKYFGWVAGMNTKDIMEKMNSLLELLQLPFPDRQIKNLSGGQQRRVSMAATFLHEPELLILDEPTVGVDPILRQKIWDYFVDLTRDKMTTIIITTHYIDETKQATTIGLMRGGKFLAEESPDELLSRYNSESLEDAFLKLSVLQNKGKRRRSSISSNIVAATAPAIPELQDMGIMNEGFDTQSEISGEFGENMSVNNFRASITSPAEAVDAVPPDEEVEITWKDYFNVYTSHHMKALVWKNALYMLRNIGVLLWIILMPVLEVVIFSLAIGHDPTGLHVAVVNEEFTGVCQYNSSCEAIYSCRYLHHLGKLNHELVNYDMIEEAEYAVKKGWAWGMIRIPPDFTENINSRIELGINANDSAIDGGEIDAYLDMSNQQIGYMLKRDLIQTLENFAADVAKACMIPTKAISLPLRINNPIYGPRVPNFTDFAAPGVMLTIVFFLSVALTSGTMLVERNEGILERCLVSGITGLEILSSHVITQFLVMLGQTICVVGFALYVFNITNQGSVVWVTVLMVMCGTCGMAYGFVVSCVCDSERNATYLALGSFLPFVMLCGIIWPVEGMHKILRTIAYFLPLTLSTESLRSMLARGWDLNRPTVYSGFISTGLWILIYMLASVLLLKFKKG